MRKIIAIGESVLDTLYRDGQPVRAFVGGRIACAAAALGTMGLSVAMVSECATDSVGDLVVEFHRRHKVDTRSIDRYTDGTTALSAIFVGESDHKAEAIVNYGRYPVDRFDVIWPRIDEDDIVIFGSLYAIDTPQRERLYELLNYAVSRKAILIYLPGFQHGVNFRITRVMPAILENIEISHLVVAHERDIRDIFPGEAAHEAFHNHVEYYGATCLYLDAALRMEVMRRDEHFEVPVDNPSPNLLGWQAGLTAGLVEQLIKHEITQDMMNQVPADTWRSMLTHAVTIARRCAASPENTLDALQ